MEFSQIKEKINVEYQKLCNNPEVNQALIQHPQFLQVVESIFMSGIDLRQNYKVEVVGNSIVISSTSNYPEATNGVYKGFEGLEKYVIEIDREHLAVKEEHSSIFKFPNKDTNSLSYSSKVTAYDNEKEAGYSMFSRQEEVHKNYRALDALRNTNAQPELSTGYALSGMPCEPRQSDFYCNYRSEGCRRWNGIAAKEIINRTGRTTKEHLNTYSSVYTEHPERLTNNLNDFATTKKQENGRYAWETMTGIPLTEEELNQMISEYSQSSTMAQTGHSR